MKDDEILKEQVLSILEKYANSDLIVPVSRRELCTMLNRKDRQIRRAIEALRRDGHFILTYGFEGYWLADRECSKHVPLIRDFYWTEVHRAAAIFRRLKPVRQFLKERGEKV